MLSGSDYRLAVGPCDLVDVVRTDKAQITEEALGFLLGPSCGDCLPSICNAVIGLDVCGDHVVLLVELCLVWPDTWLSGNNHTHLLTIGQTSVHWIHDIEARTSLSRIHSDSIALTAWTMSH